MQDNSVSGHQAAQRRSNTSGHPLTFQGVTARLQALCSYYLLQDLTGWSKGACCWHRRCASDEATS